MKGILKTSILLTMVVVVGSLAGCNSKQSEPKPINPPTQEETQNVQLLAPTIWLSPELVLQISPNSDLKTQEKTTGYEVTINGETQILTKDELSLELGLTPGSDVIEVKAIGGEKTESKQVATLTVTEEQKAMVAYNKTIQLLNNILQEKLDNSNGGSEYSNYELINFYQQGNHLDAVVRYDIDGLKIQRTITLENIAENYNNIFDLMNILEENNSISTSISAVKVFYGNTSINALLQSNYLSSQSDLQNYLNNGWSATVIDENMTTITSSLGEFNGLQGYHRFTTTAIIKLEKDGAEDIYLNTSYRVSIDRSYDKSTLIESIANGTINATDIIIDNENVTVLEKANIYQDAKEAYEGKTAETIYGQVKEAA